MAELQQAASLCAEVVPRSGCTPTKPKIVLYKFAFRKLGRTANRIKSIRPIHPVRPARPSGTYPPRRAGRTGSKYAKIIQLYLGMENELRKPAIQICFDIIYRLKLCPQAAAGRRDFVLQRKIWFTASSRFGWSAEKLP